MRVLLRLLLLLVIALLAGAASAENAKDLPKLPQVVAPATAFEGKRVVRVSVKVEGHIWTKPPLVTLPEVDEPLVLEEARKELARPSMAS